MAPRNRPLGPRHGSAQTRSVEEILVRCGGRPIDECHEEHEHVISVAAILRREGRGPHCADGPLRPRTHLRVEDVDVVAPPPRRRVGKVTLAAGALFALGAMFGPAVLNDAAFPQAEAERPGSGPAGDGQGSGVAWLQARTPRPDASARAATSFVPTALVGSTPARSTTPVTSAGAVPAAGGAGFSGTVPGALPVPRSSGTNPSTTPSSGSTGKTPDQSSGSGTGQNPGSSADLSDPETPSRPRATVALPPVDTPAVVVPSVPTPALPVVGQVKTPAVGITPAVVDPPAVTVQASPEGVKAATSDAKVTTPDVTTSEAKLGPVAVAKGKVALPDVGVSGASVEVSPTAPPKVTTPDVHVSKTEVDTPDLTVGKKDVPLPDVELPAVDVKDVSKDPAKAVGDTAEQVVTGGKHSVERLVDGTGKTVGSLLGSTTSDDDQP